jgi:hypothetical protein
MIVAMCVGLAAYAERLWQPRLVWYFLWQCQKVNKRFFVAGVSFNKKEKLTPP